MTASHCRSDEFVLTFDRWENDNITALCNDKCIAQVDGWNFNVAYYCYGQTLSVGGKLVPADTVSGRYLDGINTACLSDLDKEGWCLTQSLDWTGSDIVRPDCSTSPSDPQCQNPTDFDASNQRLASLYPDDVLCSSWYVVVSPTERKTGLRSVGRSLTELLLFSFIQMLQARVSSPYLSDSDHSDFLVGQLQDIVDVCNNTMIPDTSTRPLFGYDIAPSPTSQRFGNGTTLTAPKTAFAAATCTGQVLKASAQKRVVKFRIAQHRARHFAEIATLDKRQDLSCDVLSQDYGVTTGELQKITGSDTCTIAGSIYLPSACTIDRVPNNATW